MFYSLGEGKKVLRCVTDDYHISATTHNQEGRTWIPFTRDRFRSACAHTPAPINCNDVGVTTKIDLNKQL